MSKVTIDLSKPVELSHTSHPEKEEYRMALETRFTDDWPQFASYKRQGDAWYIISEIVMNTHCGTHIEMPYHHVRDGQDVASFPVENLIGEGVVIDISHWRGNNARITLDDLKAASAGQIKPGDIAFFYTGNDEYYYTDRQHDRPWFTTDCIDWLAHDVGIKVMGVDTSGHEVRQANGSGSLGQPNHEVLLAAGIPLVEYLTNLQALLQRRFVAFILPVKIAGAEAFPVRVIAFAKEA